MIVLELLSVFLIFSSTFSYILSNGSTNSSLERDDFDNLSVLRSSNVKCENNTCVILNSVCINKNCECREGFVFDGTLTKCLKVSTGYNDECEESIQCSEFLSAGGICDNRACKCKNGYHYVHGRCYQSKGLNEKCNTHEECFVNAEYDAAVCMSGTCKCGSEFYQREYSTCRRKAKDFGDPCILDTDCAFNKSAKCISEKCTLQNSKIISENIDTDVIFSEFKAENEVKVGSDCKEDSDCSNLENSHCGFDKKCTCNRAFFPTKNTCSPEIGENCSPESKSAISYSVCKNGRWTCEPDRVNLKSNQLCRKLTDEIGSSCQYPESCQLFGPRAECVAGRCGCDNSSHWLPSERFCWRNRALQQPCDTDHDCYPPEASPRTVCRANVCACPDAAQPSSSGGYCVSVQPVLNNYCEESADCKLVHSSCEDRRCKCSENYFELDGKCLAGLNATCTTTADCKLNYTICSDAKVCQCSENFVVSPENECVPLSKYNQSCEYDVQCSSVIRNSYCYFHDANKTTTESWFEEENGICECLPGHYLRDGMCFKKKWLGDECTREGECFTENFRAVCRNGKCLCDFKYEQEGRVCKKQDSGGGAASIRPWLVLPVAAFFALKSLR